MSNIRLDYQSLGGGVVAVVLRDDSNAWGVRAVDGGAIIIPAGTALAPDVSLGDDWWSITVGGLTAGAAYEYAIEATRTDGGTERQTQQFTAPAGVSTRTLRLEFNYTGGEPLDYVILRDAAGAWGMRRQATGDVVLVAGTPLAPDAGLGAGWYSAQALNLYPGEVYEYAVEWSVLGEVERQVQTVAAPVPAAVGAYVDQDDIIALIGADAVQVLSDVESDQLTIDVPKVQSAIDWAIAEIHRRFKKMGIFKVPLAGLDDDARELLRDVGRMKAAYWLAQRRGVVEHTASAPTPAEMDAAKRLATLYENYNAMADAKLDDVALTPRQFTADRISSTTPRLVSVGTGSGWRALPTVYAPLFPIPPLMIPIA